ncbi:TadE/TadG family type IV pilus assembly protein [Paraburkholderia sp. BL10I2N1]|uniref:TadE/TadG family type IV pilus assembly protein n=1 Tax=Paraburkholderia sp. BL10I2N1 TaxID=1938796 RepID=UPI0010615D32|nr:TadE/TadG family type IV pilus assembly protein [Paraburkholderia sp. BL10I2N1]TDN67269.1 TadE-like protein [Paraburkholderia sp. BL10I2N1]
MKALGPPSLRDERGVAALEFALMLPFLLMVLFGIIDVSMILTDKAVITNASREAARAGVVLRVTPLTSTQIQNVALNYTQNNLVTGGTATSATAVASGTPVSGSPLTVTVTYTYKGFVLGSIFSAITGPVTISAVTKMNYE